RFVCGIAVPQRSTLFPSTTLFRSIGGDKVLPYIRHPKEENPALGWRAIRMSLDRPGLFRTQVQALLRAAAGRELNVMIPMVSAVDRKSTRLNSSHVKISYAVFCLK